MQAESALQLTDANYEQEVHQFSGVVLVDFWAVWCGPCQLMTTRIEELAQKYKNDPRVKIAQLNIDENQETSSGLRVMSIPTFHFYIGGQIQPDLMTIGAQPTVELEKRLQSALAKVPAAQAA